MKSIFYKLLFLKRYTRKEIFPALLFLNQYRRQEEQNDNSKQERTAQD